MSACGEATNHLPMAASLYLQHYLFMATYSHMTQWLIQSLLEIPKSSTVSTLVSGHSSFHFQCKAYAEVMSHVIGKNIVSICFTSLRLCWNVPVFVTPWGGSRRHLYSSTSWGEGPGEGRPPTDTDGRKPILWHVEELQAIDYHLLVKGLGLLGGDSALRAQREVFKKSVF